jgi:hypothetical protein
MRRIVAETAQFCRPDGETTQVIDSFTLSSERTLRRTAAVEALKRLGFGKTAAYAALSQDGRFNAWLICAPDGIIAWKN